jgi:hypothetical protein
MHMPGHELFLPREHFHKGTGIPAIADASSTAARSLVKGAADRRAPATALLPRPKRAPSACLQALSTGRWSPVFHRCSGYYPKKSLASIGNRTARALPKRCPLQVSNSLLLRSMSTCQDMVSTNSADKRHPGGGGAVDVHAAQRVGRFFQKGGWGQSCVVNIEGSGPLERAWN